MTLGQKIKFLRNEKRITQKYLAEKLNVSFQTVSKWENDENEPDVATLKALCAIFDCSLDDLLSDKDLSSIGNDSKTEVVAPTNSETPQPVTQTVIIHQKEMHVCERCKKDIPEDELVMEEVKVQSGRRGRAAVYRQAYYHSKCLQELKTERAKIAAMQKKEKAERAKKLSFGWSIAGGAVSLVVALLVMLLLPAAKAVIHPGFAVLYSVIGGYAIFAAIYCIMTGSYIGDVFVWCASQTIKFPGLIFSWDLDGLGWLIAMKILFMILGFLFAVLAFLAAAVLSMALGAVSFPFVLAHNIKIQYADSLVGGD